VMQTRTQTHTFMKVENLYIQIQSNKLIRYIKFKNILFNILICDINITLLSAVRFLHDLLLSYHEDGGDMFLRGVS
jgi:hypothetical protein